MRHRIFLLAGALIALSSPAWAVTPAEQAAANALFEEGRRFSKAGDWANALPKYLEVSRIENTPGVQLNIADCLEHLGKLASAWGAYREAELRARASNDAEREAEARRRADALEPRVSKLAIVVPPAARVPGLEVRRDDQPVGEGQWGSAVPADAGQHTVQASAPGYKPWSTTVTIDKDGSAASVEVTALEKLSVMGGSGSPQRAVGIAVGSVGLVGLAVGGVLGGLAMSKYNASKTQCVPSQPNVCTPSGIDQRKTAGTFADASTGLLVAGGVLVAAGVIVFATGPSAASPKTQGVQRLELAPVAGFGTTGFSLRGAW